jgi:hypothetical protein
VDVVKVGLAIAMVIAVGVGVGNRSTLPQATNKTIINRKNSC